MSNAPETPTPTEEEVVELDVEFTPEEDVDGGPDGDELSEGPADVELTIHDAATHSHVDTDDGYAEDDELGPMEEEVAEATGDEEEVVAEIPTDEDGYLDPAALTEDEAEQPDETVVVQDFDPADPGAEIAEPQKVLKPNDRLARKAEQRKKLDK